MLIQTILNNRLKFKSFIFSKTRFENEDTLIVSIMPRKNGKPICSICQKHGPIYDTLPVRKFKFIPILSIAVFFEYAMRRVDCECGVKVEQVPWATGKETVTIPFKLFLADWARLLSWKDTGLRFGVSWDIVFRAVEYVVNWGLEHRDLSNITAVGIDEIKWRIGHTYLTLVYQINTGFQRL